MNYMPIKDDSEKLEKNDVDIESLRRSPNSLYVSIIEEEGVLVTRPGTCRIRDFFIAMDEKVVEAKAIRQ
jgi:hypothetical protein